MLPEAGALPSEAFAAEISRRLPAYGLRVSPGAVSRLSHFLADLDAARRRTNLTGPIPSLELVDHALESALGGPLLPRGGAVLDIGTGGGFPGVPLAIVRPDLAVTLLEPRPLRTAFLERAAASIGLENVGVMQGKLSAAVARRFGAATSRAVGDLARLVGTAPFLEPAGLLLAWTTAPAKLSRELSPVFRLESSTPVPGAKSKVISLFRKHRPDR